MATTHTKPKMCQCDICHREYKCKSALERHMLSHTGQRDFKCDICSKTFMIEPHLKIHMKIHTGVKEYKYLCEFCGRRFNEKWSLKTHIVNHTGMRQFKCKLCHKEYLTNSHLVQHMTTHTTRKDFKCEICSKEFICQKFLKQHLQTHQERERLPCSLCGKKLKCKKSLETHMQTHSGITFQCHLCSKEYKCKISLKTHMVKHANQSIDMVTGIDIKDESKMISKKSSSKKDLHIRKHTGVKFQCEICSTEFNQKSYLARHMLIHTHPEELTCTICNRLFSRKNRLKRHMETHPSSKESAVQLEVDYVNVDVVTCTSLEEKSDKAITESLTEHDPLSVRNEMQDGRTDDASFIQLEEKPPVLSETEFVCPVKIENDVDDEDDNKIYIDVGKMHGDIIKEEKYFDNDREEF